MATNKHSSPQKSSGSSMFLPFVVGLLVTFGLIGLWKISHLPSMDMDHSTQQNIKERNNVQGREDTMKVAPKVEVTTGATAPQPQPEVAPLPTPAPEPMPVLFDRPYNGSEKAVVGSFTEVGKDLQKSVYSYKVREKGDNKLLFTRFQQFKKGADVTKFAVLDESSTPIADGTQYTANQVLYIEYTEENPEMIKEVSEAVSCTAYTTFFTCIIATDTTADKNNMQQQYDSFQSSLKKLTPQQQNTQCASYLEKVRTKVSNEYQKTCLEKIK